MIWRTIICALCGAETARCHHEVALAQRQSLAADHAAVGNPALGDQGKNEIEQALAEEGHDGDAEQQRRKRPDDLDQFLNHKIDFTTEIARDGAQA